MIVWLVVKSRRVKVPKVIKACVVTVMFVNVAVFVVPELRILKLNDEA